MHKFHVTPFLMLKIQTLLVLFMLIIASVSNASAAELPWSLNATLGTPDWLSISGQHRTRYETLDDQFRTGGSGGDQILVFRTNILARVTWHQWEFGFELLDSRQAHADDSTKIASGDVNPLDVLQTYIQWDNVDSTQSDVVNNVRAGRFTMDVGSRRFVARNKFRNAINSFTGVDWSRTHANSEQLRVFYTLPVQRLPREFDRRKRSRTQGDNQDTEVAFWGAYYKLPELILSTWSSEVELFYFGLDENDTHKRPTRNRDIHTVGGRIYKNKSRSEFDYQIEAVYQFGESRATSSASDRDDLDHRAYFGRAELGYSIAANWSPRLVAQFDYASGDSDPNDGDNNRFDSLYGVRRSDFGPLGIYGPFARANIVSPGLRLQLKPSEKVSMFIAHRGYWLASNKDAWTVAGVCDPQGDSGSYLGQQLEARLRWNIYPKNLQWEIGGAYLFKSGFADDAPNANDEGDSNFLYSQFIFSF